jgi:hypothetical protein
MIALLDKASEILVHLGRCGHWSPYLVFDRDFSPIPHQQFRPCRVEDRRGAAGEIGHAMTARKSVTAPKLGLWQVALEM